jgi:hypothetical protein
MSGFAASGDHGEDAAASQFTAVGLTVVALVPEESLGATAWSADAAGHRRNSIDQSESLGDVGDVAARGDDQARMCEASTQALDQSGVVVSLTDHFGALAAVP